MLNRMWVAGSNNLIALSVPLEGGRSVHLPYRDIRVAYAEPWQRVHWRTLHDCYRKAPWFDQYGSDLEQLYQTRVERLVEWNRKCTDWVLAALGMSSDILAEYVVAKQDVERPKILKQPIVPTPFSYPRYHQVFEERLGFVGNLSVVDLIFCEGPAALSYLQKIAAYINHNQNTLLPDEIH